jgi:molecular chaperone HtpG
MSEPISETLFMQEAAREAAATEAEHKKRDVHKFKAEVLEILNMMIKSVYSDTEFFMRELVSNASDACDKFKTLYFELKNEGYELEDISSLRIEILADKENKTITVRDNGIGMTKADLINFIGTIANSGTRKFKEAMEAKKSGMDVSNLIGQFGLGFYSSFLVAEKVDIVTKHPRDEALFWSSSGKEEYFICSYDQSSIGHGTSVILHLKEGMDEYLESKRIIEILKKHSQFVLYPIFTYTEKEVEEEAEKTENGEGIEEIKTEDEEIEEIKTEDEGIEEVEPKAEGIEEVEPKIEEIEEVEPKVEEVKPKKLKKTLVKEQVNMDRPLWNRNVKSVPEEELKSFYKVISGDWDDFLAMDFWHIQGTFSVKLLLFIPKRARFDLFGKNKKINSVKLYCSNVFVTDDLGDAVPEWMSFISGVVAVDDLAMNISRECIQGRSVMNLIKKTLPQKFFEMIGKIAMNDAEKYKAFYKEFGNCVKMAISEATGAEQQKYAKSLRYYTTKSEDEMVGLDTYVERMQPGQEQIYVITGLGKEQVKSSPFLDAFQDYEVVYMYEVMDEVMLRGLRTYKEKSIQRISAEGAKLPGEEEADKELVASCEPLCKKVKEVLGNRVEKVVVNPKIKAIPGLISTSKYSLSSTMEAIMKSQPVTESNPFAAMNSTSRKILELNPEHAIFSSMKRLFDSNEIEALTQKIEVLYQTLLINCGFVMENPKELCRNIFSMLGEDSPQPADEDSREVL